MTELRVVHLVSKARGVVRACGLVGGEWSLLVQLDHDSPRHTSTMDRSIGPGQLASWYRNEVHVEGAP